VINLDTNTVIAFVAEGSPVRHQLRAFVDNQQLVMVQTAYDEFLRIIQASGGSAEQERAERFLKRVTVVPDNPSPAAQMLKPTRRIGENDIITAVCRFMRDNNSSEQTSYVDDQNRLNPLL
jgi:predicted nucleic acid-binding protein